MITDFSAINIYCTFSKQKIFSCSSLPKNTEKYTHTGRGQETVVMGNSHGQSKFPKKWFGNDKEENQAGTSNITLGWNQFLLKFKAVFEDQAQQPSKLSILCFAFDLNCM